MISCCFVYSLSYQITVYYSYRHVTLVRVPYRCILISLIASDFSRSSVNPVQVHTKVSLSSFVIVSPSVMQVDS
jgi:hypothetical protein